MKRTNFMIGVYVLAVFLSGILVGGFGHRLYTVKAVSTKIPPSRSPEEWRARYIEEMNSRLKLEANQLQSLNAVLDETRTLYRSAKDRSKAEMKQIQSDQRDKIRGMLSDQQKPEYEKLCVERDRQAQRHHKN